MSRKQIINQLKKSRRVLLCSHIHPDGDAIGSLIGMGLALKEMGKDIWIYNESPVPAIYHFLPSIHRIKHHPGEIGTYDTVVVMDCSDLHRIGDAAGAVNRIPIIINIDHHITNTRFGSFQLIDPDASASAEIVFRLIKAMKIKITPAIAYAIYTGIMTDTGSFRFANTNPEAFDICHEMVRLGADPHKVAHHVYETISLSRIKLLTMLFDTIELTKNSNMSIMTLTQNMLRETGTRIQDVNGLINYAKAIENVKVAALLYERAKEKSRLIDESHFHISLRSDGSVDVAKIAASFGGGGHTRAAGFDIQGSLPALKKELYELSDRL
ncbi:MAG: bifunctional oligoribonuclease/PAP phosphatase NrnA [Deltaproteobacteria bacterium]|nr:bifunctional oligoribonuclease/PAP phosphatase NrnA [Deltaproteobacteria bacterium]